MLGRVFSEEEFAVYDGPGIRHVIFLKGCPLRCAWCHNPEGLERGFQRMTSRTRCVHCGKCDAACEHPEGCVGCGACARACPMGCVRVAGEDMDSEDVARRIRRNAPVLAQSGGGVTFSGGEALLQPDFVIATRRALTGVHAAVETCGHVEEQAFRRAAREMDLVLMDVKHMDDAAHRRFTGVGNERIQQNLDWLMASGIPFIARVPLIPGVNDGEDNLRATAERLRAAKNLLRVELLAYNRAAGAKYAQLGWTYAPPFDEDAPSRAQTEWFTERGMEAVAL